MELADLISKTNGEETIGIGLIEGDGREDQLLAGVDFCPLRVYREPAELLDAIDGGVIHAGVRGSLSSAEFLAELSRRHPQSRVRRIALVTRPGGEPFLLGPVGIDEGGTMESMRALTADMRDFCALLGWRPRIGVLSAGRPEDRNRSPEIARSIELGERAASEPDVCHFNIMVEEALGWANCVIAPDGVTGNLIYRTLAHLGGGVSYGALYFPRELKLADTSRNGKLEEYIGAVALANMLAAGG